MIQRLTARPSSLNCHRQIFFNFGLSNELAQPLRPQLQLKRRIVFNWRRRHQPFALIWKVGGVPDRAHCRDSTMNTCVSRAPLVRPKLVWFCLPSFMLTLGNSRHGLLPLAMGTFPTPHTQPYPDGRAPVSRPGCETWL